MSREGSRAKSPPASSANDRAGHLPRLRGLTNRVRSSGGISAGDFAVETAGDQPSDVKHAVLFAEIGFQVAQVERMEHVESDHAQKKEGEHRASVVFVDVVGVPPRNQLVEALILDTPAVLPYVDDDSGVRQFDG